MNENDAQQIGSASFGWAIDEGNIKGSTTVEALVLVDSKNCIYDMVSFNKNEMIPPGKREMTDEEFKQYIQDILDKGGRISEIPRLRPLVNLEEFNEKKIRII